MLWNYLYVIWKSSFSTRIHCIQFILGILLQEKYVLAQWLFEDRYLSSFLSTQIISLIMTTKLSKITRDFVITHNHPQKELVHYIFPLYFLFVTIQQFFFSVEANVTSPPTYIFYLFFRLSPTLLSSFTILCLFSTNKNNLDAKSCYLLKMTITE